MSGKAIVTLGLGIIIGAAGMWFVDNSKQPAYQVDEVIEGYSIPATPMNDQAQPAASNAMPANDQTHVNNNAMPAQPAQ